MLNYKKWIAMFLALCLMFNLIPLNAVAEISPSDEIMEKNTVQPEVSFKSAAGSVQESEPETVQEISFEVATDPVHESESEVVTKPASEVGVESEEDSVPSDEPEESEPNSAYEEEEHMVLFTNSFVDDFKTVLTTNGYSTDLLQEDNDVVTLTVKDGKVLELLSQQLQTADSNYQNWIIDIGVTGQLKLTGDFIGLGDEGVPFKGTIKGSFSSIKTQHTLFKSVSSDANIISCPIKWAGTNQADPIFAKELILGCDYNIPMSLAFESADKGAFSPFVGTLSSSDGESYTATLPALNYTNADPQAVVSANTDIGLLCCNLANNMQLNVSSLTLPNGIQLQFNSSANTGGLIGNMGETSKLIISQSLTLNLRLIGGDSAGGLVGNMATGAIIEPTNTVDITAELKANNTGGIAGVVETENGTLSTGDAGEVLIRSVRANATQNAGVLYGSCAVTGTFEPLTGVIFATGTDTVREVSGPNNCGGVFGTLTINENGKCSITGAEAEHLSISSTLKVSNDISSDGTKNETRYGGIVGTLSGAASQNVLVVDFCDVTSNISVGNNTENYPGYLGGIVALQQTVTLDVANSTITVNNPTTRDKAEYGFGGLCAKLDKKALLIAGAMKVVTDSYKLIPRGGGVAGYTKEGSIVYLKNSLDLSGCLLQTNAYSGQIVGNQQSSLVYAPNVAIMRLNTSEYKGMELDDIGNYGEMYRIEGFLTVDAQKNYTTSFSKTLNKTDEKYVLNDKYDYACLALAWQSRGNFPTVNGIDASNWSTLKSSTITLGAAINMAGCGIGGLTRDAYSGDDVFAGIFNGDNHTLILDIGDDNVANDGVTKGDGRIYLHNATGLFAVLGGSASVTNLVLEGRIRLSNNKLKATSDINNSAMKSGALAALVTGNDVNITNVSTKVAFDAISNGENHLYLGGLVGLIGNISGNNPKLTLTAGSGTELQANINLSHSNDGSFNHIGGAVGGIDDKSSVDVTCNGATLGGSITSTGTITNLYAGGLIGTIMPKKGATRNITLTSLNVNNFQFAGAASARMGGILGGIWADTDVNITNVTTTGTTLTSSGAADLGGLVYRASGKWTVSNANFNGLTIAANSNTKALGLMVCHGDPYKEPINNKNATTDMNALYLEMTQYWETGYQVPTVNDFGNGVFDEFVAYTAYADRTASSPNYDITHNGGGVISLKTEGTEGNAVNMTSGNRNTYVNRTVGVSVTTNNFSRYYYNLDSIMSGLNNEDNNINTPQELLIWSVYRYAADNLKTHFSFTNVESSTIGGSSSTSRADFDMVGLSYYPIDITNSDVTVQYADVKFYNKDIEEKEKGNPENKSTRGTDSDHTQHYMMHCALFHDYKAENITKTEDYILTVNGVSFAGIVGVVNGGSGSLICGMVAGQTISGKTSVCKVILADADDANKAVTLGGISVDPTGDYTPVLINKIKDYSALSANYITTGDGQTMIAGSSIIGDVGEEGASKLTVTFGGTIKLPENKEGDGLVFTKATLLNSLRYATGSAVYNFAKEKDYNSDEYVHNATHGRELGEDVSVEHVDEEGNSKQGKYQGSGEYVSKNNNFTAYNDFSSDLPYVALSPATGDLIHILENQWHELAVNIPSTDLIDGCGTYGHPYMITTATFLVVANYINGGTPAEDWKICIPVNKEVYHPSANPDDHTLTYKNGKWIDENNADYTEDVRAYLQSAYYQLSADLTLSNFNGIGANSDTVFKGVIDGNGKAVTLTGTSSAFIKYSYGSVVRNLTVTLNQNPTLTRATWTRGTPEQAPGTFFGGVIGCILGGDNIIENVTVSRGENPNVTPSGTNPHLVPVGGYVGVIAGGGVIFRGSYSEETGITGTEAQLYRNPYIGRVLGGYAFYEGSENAPNNTDKNYTINKLKVPSNDLIWNGTALTVNNAQGLLVLSAIVSSGAGSTNSNAYAKGVARTAKYDSIGSDTKPDDYETAKKDAGTVWEGGNTPYLLAKYANYTGTATICSRAENSGITIKFADHANFDMTGYGNGYRGLSARYVSNAAFKDSTNNGSTVTTVDPSMVVLRVLTFDGQNATVQNMNMNVKEYDKDDFHVASIGGIFNIVWTQKQSGGGGAGSNFAQNLTLQDCNVSLKYFNNNGTEQNLANGDTIADADGRYSVSVGGFIGMANDIDANTTSQRSLNHNYLFANIHIKGTDVGNKCKIYGPNGAGGVIGTTAMASKGVTGYPGILLANGKWALFGPSILNCSYQNIEVSGGMAAGGLIGDAYASGESTVPGFSGLGISYGDKAFLCYASCTVTDENLTVGKDSTITARAKASIAAGVFGAAGMRVGVNESEKDRKEKTGLTIEGEIQKLILSGVDILVSKENYNGSNPDSDANYAYAGGIIARIGSENPVWFYDVEINGGSVKSTLATASYVGGIVGSGYTNKEDTMERCHITNLDVQGVYAGGFLGRGYNAPGFTLNLSDCSIIGSEIIGTGSGYAGGVVGDAASNYNLYNLLIKNTSIKAETGGNAGRLFGRMNINDKSNDFKVYAAGISVFSNEKNVIVPDKEGWCASGKNYVGYIAYADYQGYANFEGTERPANYPSFMLNGVNKTIYGDAVGKIDGDTYNSVAARIWADQKGASDKKNYVSYQNVKEIVENNDIPEITTFKEFQEYGDEAETYTNFPMLVLKGGDANPIQYYLNMIINGDYLNAEKNNRDFVTIEKPKVYYYDTTNHDFREATEEQLNKHPASIIKTASNTFEVKTGSYDNTLNRFTLLEVKFKTTVNGEDKYYTVSIPVVVERELQYDFIATFTPGTVFNKDFYTNLREHVLESTGTAMTALISYRYNRELNRYTEYDWQSYLDSGEDGYKLLFGDGRMDKILSFDGGLPAKTQMILIDCQNGNQAYQYEVASNITSVKLSDFISVCDPLDKFQASIGVALGITAAEDSGGKYVRTESSNDAVLLRDGYYYALAKEGDTSQHYRFTVLDLESSTAEENYYLVITVPENDDPTYKLNGSLSSQLDWSVPTSGTQVHRNDPTSEDDRSQTESTYQIYSGYQQDLVTRPADVQTFNVDTVDKTLKIDLDDIISFDKEQLYTENDKLFLKFTASLATYTVDKDDNNKVTSSPAQFPVGTSGIVKFYVHDGNDNYYVPEGDGWRKESGETVACQYDWESNGANIELPLSKDGNAALDLSGVRTAVKGQANSGVGRIIVTAKMDVAFGSQSILDDTIPTSTDGTDAYAKLHYVSRLSTVEEALNYSVVRANETDKVQYYRAVQENVTLSMDAITIDRLGINPLQLVEDSQSMVNGKNASWIDMMATLDFGTPEKAQMFLEKTETLRFSLSLERRNGSDVNGEKKFDSVSESADTLLAVKWSEENVDGNFGWSLEVPRDKFVGDNVDVNFFNGTMFTIPLTAYVYTESTNFANYKLKIKVSFLDANGIEVAELPVIDDKDAYVVYTYACIKPTFYDPSW